MIEFGFGLVGDRIEGERKCSTSGDMGNGGNSIPNSSTFRDRGGGRSTLASRSYLSYSI